MIFSTVVAIGARLAVTTTETTDVMTAETTVEMTGAMTAEIDIKEKKITKNLQNQSVNSRAPMPY